MDYPEVSVLTPTYNRKKFLELCIFNLKNQSIKAFTNFFPSIFGYIFVVWLKINEKQIRYEMLTDTSRLNFSDYASDNSYICF